MSNVWRRLFRACFGGLDGEGERECVREEGGANEDKDDRLNFVVDEKF